ncbi:MAG: 16S rRNA (guanine(527)-N(7))-methyltransferase RsmG [Gammaproteobacteria bacterium]|jgi:16S rRNA (guanine527-N7)-methyltransferase|nr:16S rRNA (guanine(527)-N(7))-methyltransferase RsmG [Gammaproteobacteria bacterium]MBT4146311.1 16S rRNA (guanine(527)-N(7))-methyltransferase RsmG [Gammaproteobacteria bacterium]MBT5222453.1 16S rRNA (guanine(527)-N(7))-methyltransferase RsmG [Gammaproteobacteria bacterium]MBT5824641.1 16S rRNA (guanine(527)-N(7))-methyltransferase RsmG [Gammaproteobacteria bacterium]MBT5967048.1 16S rRNA (guanine(527)-N(7))-methyltransferase RsmG [Gammaproteobacteria bacterium]
MDDSRQLLIKGIEYLRVDVSPAQIDLLLAFVSLIQKWNKAYNLTAIRDRDEMLRLHILDSLAILPYVTGQKIIDVGTGAGLPGIPLAILMPEVQFTLLDSNSKKTRFVQQVVLELKLNNVEVVHSRVEKLERAGEYDAVLSRAFASVDGIMNLTEHLLQAEGVLIAMKGQSPEAELKNIQRSYTVNSIVLPGVEAERCVLRINKI